jgi:hypothetical protein
MKECPDTSGVGSIVWRQEEQEEEWHKVGSHFLFTPLSFQKLFFLQAVGVNNIKAISLSLFPLCLSVCFNQYMWVSIATKHQRNNMNNLATLKNETGAHHRGQKAPNQDVHSLPMAC